MKKKIVAHITKFQNYPDIKGKDFIHLLVLPSWFPSPEQPFAGRFIFDQVLSLSKEPNLKITVLNWGPNEWVLKVREPLKSCWTFIKYLFAKTRVEIINNNLLIYHLRHLTWYSKIFHGNTHTLITKIKANYPKLKSKFGEFSLIHAHVAFPAGYIAYKLSEELKIAYIITEHSGPFPFLEYLKRGRLKDIVLLPLKNAKGIICVSSIVKSQVSKYTDVPMHIICNQIDTDFFSPDNSTSNDFSIVTNKTTYPTEKKNEHFTLFTLSHLTITKGISDYLQALKLIKDMGYKLEVRIGGSGKDEKKLIRKAKRLRLKNTVTWLGQLSKEQAKKEYQNCSFYVMPSRSESLSMVILEAFACGKPVVATACGGPQDLVSDITGILVRPNDPTDLAQGIIRMMKNLNEYKKDEIRDYCLQRYSPKVINNKLTSYYVYLLQSTKRELTEQ